MNNFYYYNPTKLHFGENQWGNIAKEIPNDANILLLYGGGSIKKNGIYEKVTQQLMDFKWQEFGGIPANPEYEILLEALAIIKKEKITYLLAVGGGSVIDGTKFLAAAALYEGKDPWELLTRGKPNTVAMPFGTVLTIPATGSEMNSGTVISRRSTQEKLAMGGPALFPQFSILDPTVVSSLPKKQIANGLADAYTHVLEQYMTYPVGADLQDRIGESVLQTLIEVAPKILANASDYKAAANFMWSCTMALNGLLNKGVPTDWAIHAMGHELTALYGIDHARTLAILAGRHYAFNFESKKEKLAQYAERVWGVTEGTIEEKARKAIEKTDEFFHSIEIDTKLSDYTDDYKKAADIIAEKFTQRGWLGLGEHQNLSPDKVKEIVTHSY